MKNTTLFLHKNMETNWDVFGSSSSPYQSSDLGLSCGRLSGFGSGSGSCGLVVKKPKFGYIYNMKVYLNNVTDQAVWKQFFVTNKQETLATNLEWSLV